MSLLPYMFNDPWDYLRPSRILNQHFGLGLDPEDLLSPLTLPREVNSLLRWHGYKPWSGLWDDSDLSVSYDKDKFQVSVDVQQFAPNEITVQASGDNTITVEGKHEERPDEHGYISRQFVRRYVLPKGHDIKQVVSNLSSDGVLTITAPRTDNIEAIDSRNIPIQQTGRPSKPIENKKKKDKK